MVLLIIVILVGVGLIFLTPFGDVVEQYAGIDIPDTSSIKSGFDYVVSEDGLQEKIDSGFDWLRQLWSYLMKIKAGAILTFMIMVNLQVINN